MRYLGLLLALAPLLPIARIANADLERARDRWLRAMLLVGAAALVFIEPLFVPLALWLTWQWRGGQTLLIAHGWEAVCRQLGELAFWAAILGSWMLARSLAASLVLWLLAGWGTIAGLQVGEMLWQRWHGRLISGTLGQRTVAAGYLALLVPFAPWPVWPILGVGLWLTGPSWAAVLALIVGLGVLDYRVWVGSLCAAAAGGLLVAIQGRAWVKSGPRRQWSWALQVLEAMPRGASLDTVETRLGAWRVAFRSMTWAGIGPGNTNTILFRSRHAHKTRITESDLHCDPLQFALEYGLAGWATIALACWRIGSGLHWGDPWSAAAIIGAVLALTGIPLRVAPVGLTILTIWARVAP